MKLNLDCVHFIGEKPCKYKRSCQDCIKYKPIRKRILIIKLGSMGDVLRTTPIVRGLKKKYPDSRITWITRKESLPLLENNPLLDVLLPYGPEALTTLLSQKFDLVISLDKTSDSTGLAEIANSGQKLGFGLSCEGRPYPLNKSSEYAFRLGISDDLKFKRNKKSYQEIIFEVVGLEYKGEKYILNLAEEQDKLSKELRRKFDLKKKDRVIGFNTGCGDAFQGKKWTIEGFLELGMLINKKLDAKILLLGGKNEVERNKIILKKAGFPIIDSGCDNSLKSFISIINVCNLLICGDTVAMHVAIALKKKVVALFGPTVPQEIDLYGRGKKIVGRARCSPCYKRVCDQNDLCMRKIKAEAVFKSIQELSDE